MFTFSSFIGASIYDGKNAYYFDEASLLLNRDLLKDITVTFDYKKNIVFLNKLGIETHTSFDTLIASYLLEYNVKDDISYISTTYGVEIPYYDTIVSKKNPLTEEELITAIVKKSKFLYDTYEDFNNKLKTENLLELYTNI